MELSSRGDLLPIRTPVDGSDLAIVSEHPDEPGRVRVPLGEKLERVDVSHASSTPIPAHPRRTITSVAKAM